VKKKIQVTQDDIDSGKRRVMEGCPIHLAIVRAAPMGFTIGVGFNDVFFERNVDGDGSVSEMPPNARKWRDLFDERGRKAVKPFSFRLSVPK
jgi:hypothetical protein